MIPMAPAGPWRKPVGIRARRASSIHPDRLVDLRRIGDGIPAVSQVEPHAFHQQRAARRYMEKYGIRHER